MTVKTLRHYERMRLLVPNEVDEWTRYRYYDVAQMQQLNGILRLKEMGFSLEEVRDLLDEGTHKPSLKQLEAKIKQVEEHLKTLQERLVLLRRMASSQTKLDSMARISVQELPEICVASHRQVLARRKDLTRLCSDIIGPAIQQAGAKRSLPIYSFVVEHEQEFKTQDIDTEYCEQVEHLMPDTPLIKFRRLPRIPLAVCMKCYGPYERLFEQFADLFAYIDKHGYQICGLYRRQYVEGPWNQKDPEKWLTIIQMPVEIIGASRHREEKETTNKTENTMKPRIETREPVTAVACSMTGRYETLPYPKAWEKIMKSCEENQIENCADNAEYINVFYDNPTLIKADNCRADVCLAAPSDKPDMQVALQAMQLADDLHHIVIPGGRYLVFTHQGPYEELGRTYAAIYHNQLPKSPLIRDYQMRSFMFEKYLNDPSATPPEDLLTEIWIPITP